MNIKKRIRDVWSAEAYLFKLMIRMNGAIGIIIIIISLINRFWYTCASFIDKFLLDELMHVYSSKIITLSICCLIGIQLCGKIFNNFLSCVRGILEEYTQNKATLYLDNEVMNRVASMDSSYFDNPENRDAIRVANQSKNMVSESIGWSVSMITITIGFAINTSLFLVNNPILGIVFLVTYIPGAIVNLRNKNAMHTFSMNNIPSNRKKDYYRSLLTSSSSAKDVRLYHLVDYFKNIYNDLWNSIRGERYNLFKRGAIKTFVASLLTTIGFIVIIVCSVISVINNEMTLGDMTLYISLASITGNYFNNMIDQILGHFQYCIPQVNAFLEFMDYENKFTSKGTLDLSESPTIELRNVSFRYPGCEDYALNNISFKLNYGEKIALLGVNGAGKTTIVKLLLRFYKPTSGEILLNGKNIWEYSQEAYSKVFGASFQDINHYALTIRDSIALSDINNRHDEKKISDAAIAVGVDKIAENLSSGYDTELTREFSDSGLELSGGQWQKLSIARAFFSDAPIIILDEPSSALDPEAEDEIFRTFKLLCKNRSGILISHRLSSSILVDRVILIENGKLAETGTHDELVAKNGRYAALYSMQAEKYKKGKYVHEKS